MLVAPGAFARDAGAQLGQDAALAGTVEDSSGAVLAGVTVLASSVQLLGGPRATVTDSRGRYRFPVLAPGEYVIEASLAGFKPARLDAIQAPPGLALNLAPGATDNVAFAEAPAPIPSRLTARRATKGFTRGGFGTTAECPRLTGPAPNADPANRGSP